MNILLLLLLLPLRRCVFAPHVLQEKVPPPLRHVHLVPEQVLALPWQRWRLHNTRPSAIPAGQHLQV
jgi:hypothetical protein